MSISRGMLVQRRCVRDNVSGFNPNGCATSSFTVPTGVTVITADMQGATGQSSGTSPGKGFGGAGARLQCTIPVTPGETLTVIAGEYCSGGSLAGHGGSHGGTGSGAGGDASAILRGSTRLAIAAGGGGGGYHPTATTDFQSGFDGGGLTGDGGSGFNGGGGGPTGGGAGGSAVGGSGSNGASSAGGVGGPGSSGGGGGGGGYYGGGGGAGGNSFGSVGGGGGGGSSYTDASCTGVTHTRGFNTAGHGSVQLYW